MSKKKAETNKVNFDELIWNNLSNPCLTRDKSGYTWTHLNLENKKLDSLSPTFALFKQITILNLSTNNLVDFSHLSGMDGLICLDLSNNSVKDLKPLTVEDGFKSLKSLNVSNCKIVDLVSIKVANLEILNLNENKIEKFEGFEGHPKLKKLMLKKNKIKALTGLSNMPELKELYLSENVIKQFLGLENLPNLQILHLRKNQIETFEETAPALENLQYLNLRQNKIDKFEELQKLQSFSNLQTIIISFNTIIQKNLNSYYFDTLNIFPRIQRINKLKVTQKVREKWIEFSEQKYLADQAEKARLEREQAERERLEAEAAEQKPEE